MKRASKKPKFSTTTIEANGHKISTSREYSSSDEEEGEDAFDRARVETVQFEKIATSKTKSCAECWGCMFRFGKQRMKNKSKVMDFMVEIYNENKDTMAERDLAEMISRAHEEKVRIPEVERGNLKALEWTPEQVLVHLKFHMQDMRRNIQATIRDYTIIEAELQNSLFIKNEGSDTTTPDYAALTAYLNVGNKKLAMIAALKNTM